MDLKLKELSDWLKVSEKTIYRWISQEKIPYYRIEHQYRFRREEILNWMAVRKKKLEAATTYKVGVSGELKISGLLKKGGIYYKIEGRSKREVLEQTVKMIPCGIHKSTFLSVLWERESLASTGVGKGIALPHARIPILSDIRFERVSLCLLDEPVDYGSLDGQKVFALFVIQSADLARHLEVVSRLGYLCRMDKFAELLKSNPRREELFSFIEKEEENWEGEKK